MKNAHAEGLIHSGEKIAVQVRKEERADVPYAPFTVKAALDHILVSEVHAEPVVRYADQIISIYIHAKNCLLDFLSQQIICLIGQAEPFVL